MPPKKVFLQPQKMQQSSIWCMNCPASWHFLFKDTKKSSIKPVPRSSSFVAAITPPQRKKNNKKSVSFLKHKKKDRKLQSQVYLETKKVFNHQDHKISTQYLSPQCFPRFLKQSDKIRFPVSPKQANPVGQLNHFPKPVFQPSFSANAYQTQKIPRLQKTRKNYPNVRFVSAGNIFQPETSKSLKAQAKQKPQLERRFQNQCLNHSENCDQKTISQTKCKEELTKTKKKEPNNLQEQKAASSPLFPFKVRRAQTVNCQQGENQEKDFKVDESIVLIDFFNPLRKIPGIEKKQGKDQNYIRKDNE